MNDICQHLVKEYLNLRALLPSDGDNVNNDVIHEMSEITGRASLAGCGGAFAERLKAVAERSERKKKYFLAKVDHVCIYCATSFDMTSHCKYIDLLLKESQSDNLSQVQEHLFNAASNAYLLANNEDLALSAYEIMEEIRKTLRKRDFFPLVTEMGSWGDFQKNVWNDICNGRETLYHTVPRKFSANFEKGVLGFRSLRSLRGEESKCKPEDGSEGTSYGSGYIHGEKTKITAEAESFIFCLTKCKNAAFKRKDGIVYEVNMLDFIGNLFNRVKGRQGCDWMEISGLKYYDSGKRYKNRSFEANMIAGDVFYKGQDDVLNPTAFIKRTHFEWEKEVRIVLSVGPKWHTAIKAGEHPKQYLTGKRANTLAFVKVANPSRWIKKIGST